MKTFKEFINEGKLKVKDEVIGADGQLKDRKGKVISIKGDMAQIDFGGGDKYGITLSRIKDGKVYDKPVMIDEETRKLKNAQEIIDNNQSTKLGDTINGRKDSVVSKTKLVSISKSEMVYVREGSITVLNGKDDTEDTIYVDLSMLKKVL